MNRDSSPEWLKEFSRELVAGLKSQQFTDAVEIFVISESPRVLAFVVETDGCPPEGIIRDIDHAIAVDPGATLETVALDIAVSDIAEPGPPGVALSSPELEQITLRWPNITWTGNLNFFGTK